MTQAKQQDKIQEIMRAVLYYNGATTWCNTEKQMAARAAIESKLRELVREQEEAKKYLDALAMCMFEKHYAKDEPYASGAVKFELFDSLPGVISQIDNMASGLERAHGITSASGEV